MILCLSQQKSESRSSQVKSSLNRRRWRRRRRLKRTSTSRISSRKLSNPCWLWSLWRACDPSWTSVTIEMCINVSECRVSSLQSQGNLQATSDMLQSYWENELVEWRHRRHHACITHVRPYSLKFSVCVLHLGSSLAAVDTTSRISRFATAPETCPSRCLTTTSRRPEVQRALCGPSCTMPHAGGPQDRDREGR